MKIAELKTFVVGNPPPAFGGRYFLFLKLKTGCGIEGVGEVYAASFAPKAIVAMIEDVFERHVDNAQRVAEFLRADARVEWVNYAGFPDNPYYELARKYLGGRACSLLTFGVRGGFEAGTKFYDALKLVKRLVNMGDAKSLACHPASTTHRQMPPEEQRKAGVRPEMIRLSIGIEHIDDIIADLDQALAETRASRSIMVAAE